MKELTIKEFIERDVTNGIGYASNRPKSDTEWGLQTRLCRLERDTAKNPSDAKMYDDLLGLMEDIRDFCSWNYEELPSDISEINRTLGYYCIEPDYLKSVNLRNRTSCEAIESRSRHLPLFLGLDSKGKLYAGESSNRELTHPSELPCKVR